MRRSLKHCVCASSLADPTPLIPAEFAGDEHLAGRSPNRGIELCGIVETIYSLGVLHRVHGDVAFADRAEMIAYNAQPAAMTADMWARNYLSTINEIAAVNSNPHAWITDGPASTTYGLEPNFPCCTANHNQ